jgi:methylthioribose-1-phosphate isomerase
MRVSVIEWRGDARGHAELLDQTRLPLECLQLEVREVQAMHDCIQRLAVRGAPAIGVAAAYGVCLALRSVEGLSVSQALVRVEQACALLARSRPTAVNLFWALERMQSFARLRAPQSADAARFAAELLEEARTIHREDAAACRRMGELGAELLRDGMTLLTHCNAGALATAGMGTALAPIYVASEQGKRVRVFADETRPLLQGARLTAWELLAAGIEVTLITDSMAGRVMYEGRIDAVIVGADRIARNGDVCNKIGTYALATLAAAHRIPFYVVAPLSTFDARIPDGSHIHIEERGPEEVTEGLGRRTAPPGIKVYNPAFDVTPARLVRAIVTEAGVIHEPDWERVGHLLSASQRR